MFVLKRKRKVRLYVKAHKYIKRWKDKQGKWQYEYAKKVQPKQKRGAPRLKMEARLKDKIKYWEKHRVEIEREQAQVDPNFDYVKELAKLKGKVGVARKKGQKDVFSLTPNEIAIKAALLPDTVYSKIVRHGPDVKNYVSIAPGNKTKRMLIPKHAVKGYFQILGHEFVVHNQITTEGVVLTNQFIVTHRKSGLRSGSPASSIHKIVDEFRQTIHNRGVVDVQGILDRAGSLPLDEIAIDMLSRYGKEMRESEYYARSPSPTPSSEDPSASSSSGLHYSGKSDVAEIKRIKNQILERRASGEYHTPEKIQHALKTGKVAAEPGLGGGVNETFLVELENDVKTVGVYKPLSGEKKGMRRYVPNETSYLRERAAYLIDQAIGFDLVPPTVIRENMDEGVGSVQEFAVEAMHGDVDDSIDHVNKFRAGVFDFIVMNVDRHGGNAMYTGPENTPVLIDNGLTLPIPGGDYEYNPSVFWKGIEGKMIPNEIVVQLERADWYELRENLERLNIEAGALDEMQKRANWLMEQGEMPGYMGRGGDTPWRNV